MKNLKLLFTLFWIGYLNFSCSNSTTFTIEDVGKPTKISLHNSKGLRETSAIILENTANDTVIIFARRVSPGQVGFLYHSSDIYREKDSDIEYHYVPYKATKGHLKVRYTDSEW